MAPSPLVQAVAEDYRLLNGIIRYIGPDPEHWEYEPSCTSRLLALIAESEPVLPPGGVLWRGEPLLTAGTFWPDYPHRGFRSWTESVRMAELSGTRKSNTRWRLLAFRTPVRALSIAQVFRAARSRGLSATVRDHSWEWLVLDEDIQDADVITGPALDALCKEPDAGLRTLDRLMGHTGDRRSA